MSVVNFGTSAVFNDAQASVVIRKYLDGIKGGKVLDLSNYSEEFVKAGHIIIKNSTTGVYAPMPVAENAFGALPNGYEYVGVGVNSILTAQPEPVGILTIGEVNDLAMPYELTSAIKTAFLSAVPTIRFNHD